ncbi:MAG: FAD-dependent oxidoreductase [Clostridium sp.]|nr:FAD-dependent oxidoreductase [Clostridium sp.]
MRVAIIGAGFSGLTAAYLLEKKGISVTVYEKEALLGGHCMTLINKDLFVELGTAFSFSGHIKELLLELKIPYHERFIYRNFVDEHYQKVEHLSSQEVGLLLGELTRLQIILAPYLTDEECFTYNQISNLRIPLDEFLEKHNLHTVRQVMTPYLSSFGFGNTSEIQAYYAFNIFDLETLHHLIRGDKLLFMDQGVSEIIRKLSQNISDIRYSIEVTNIEPIKDKVNVQTPYGEALYDKVLITTKLPKNVINDGYYNDLMGKIETNPYITAAYEVENKNIVTTYYKANLGKKDRLQFFHTYKEKDKKVLGAYAYGTKSTTLINNVTEELKKTGIHIKHLITAKQWYIFPHIKSDNLTQNLYLELIKHQESNNICLIGSLVSKPAISNLYASVKTFIRDNF